jgi:hypothetical protein
VVSHGPLLFILHVNDEEDAIQFVMKIPSNELWQWNDVLSAQEIRAVIRKHKVVPFTTLRSKENLIRWVECSVCDDLKLQLQAIANEKKKNLTEKATSKRSERGRKETLAL